MKLELAPCHEEYLHVSSDGLRSSTLTAFSQDAGIWSQYFSFHWSWFSCLVKHDKIVSVGSIKKKSLFYPQGVNNTVITGVLYECDWV